MVLPTEGITLTEELEVLEEENAPTKTYKLDFVRGRCSGFIDGREAMEQAIYKMLNTKRFAHLIYSDDFGFESLTGRERLFVRGDLPRRIEEALLQDERITAVEDMVIDFINDEAHVFFTAKTVYGDVNVLRGVIPFV